jgi:predicted GTPase
MVFDWAGSLPRSEIVNFLALASDKLDGYADLDATLKRADHGFARAAEKVAEQAARYQEPFRLVVVGEFNAGKSALINALLGHPSFLLEGRVPTTGSITEVWWDREESGDVFDADGKQLFAGDLATAVKYTDQRTSEGSSLARHGARIVLRTAAPLLRNLVIIDTPGLGASARDDGVTRAALDLADAAVLVVSALQPGGEDTIQLAEWLRTHRRRVLLAVTWLDMVEDANEALSAASELLEAVIDGAPIGVNPPEVHKDLAALKAAEACEDAAAMTAARELLAAHGYTDLMDRLQGDFARGDAGLSRLHAAMASVVGVLRQVAGDAGQSSVAVESELEAAHAEVGDLLKRVHTVLPDRASYLDEKIDEAVDVRIGEFIARLSEAVDLFVDKIADGSLRATVRALRSFTRTGKQRIAVQIERDFKDLFPDRQLEIVVSDLARAVSALLRAEWGTAATELAPMVPGRDFSMESVSKGLIEQIAAANVSVLARATAMVTALFGPGGIIFDLAALVLSVMRRQPPGQRLARAVANQKREARVRIRNRRAELVDEIGEHYRRTNHVIKDQLLAEATKDHANREQDYDQLQARLGRLRMAVTDLSRLEADALGLSGRGEA